MFNLEKLDFETVIKINGVSDILNKKINKKVNDLLKDIKLNILECESPIEQIFMIDLSEEINEFYFNYKIKKTGYDFLGLSLQQKIGKYRVDFVLEFQKNCELMKKFVVELDGHEFHEKTKEQVKNDKEKDRFLTSEGFIVIRFTGSEIYNNCSEKVDELLNIIYKECGR